jgi:outer membrane protein OmpA-like peptidoglycan-associated protein
MGAAYNLHGRDLTAALHFAIGPAYNSPMSQLPRTLPLALLLVAAATPAADVLAQPPGLVRVVNNPAPIRRWFRAPVTDVLMMVNPGVILDVLDEERGWYWVVAPPDAHGTRRAGWIRTTFVEAVASRPPRPRPPAAALETPSNSSAASLANAADDRVTITTHDAAATPASGAAIRSAFMFDDVHFDRDRHDLRAEDIDLLRSVVTALKADPLLAVNIEGYTCNLGTPAHNMALGVRRATAVRDYLVSQGIAADRLHTASRGEAQPKHDNSHEETRRLNRRVAFIPEANSNLR